MTSSIVLKPPGFPAWEARRCFRASLLSAAIIAVAGCAVSPEPFTAEETKARVERDKALIFGDAAPVSGAISLDEAMARAVKFNLDHRAELLNEVVSQKQLDLSSYDLLPKLVTSAGLNSRSADSASSSESILTHSQSLEPSISTERTLVSSQTALTWNILDFGVSYIRAHQNADRTLIADEQRRKVVHNILQDVRTVWWRAVASERLLGRIDPLLRRTEKALADAQALEKQMVRPPLEELQYQRTLLSTLERLRALRRELVGAKTQLAALMNLRPGTPFQVKVPDGLTGYAVPALAAAPAEMEEVALYRRPELIQASYESRISGAETRRILLEMLPGLSLSAGGNYDSNRFSVNNAWASYGASVAWNLLTVVSTPARLDLADADQQLKEVKRAALSMAVLAQVNVAYLRYQQAVEEFTTARAQAEVENRILNQLTTAGTLQQIGDLAVIQAEAEEVFAALRRDIAYAGLQNAYGGMMVSVGADPLPGTVSDGSLSSLTKAVGAALRSWEDGSALKRALAATRDAAKPATPPAEAPKISDATPAAILADHG